MKRTLLAAVLLLTSLGQAGAQEQCDADPKWLVVTIIDGEGRMGDQDLAVSTGTRFLQRCNIVYIAALKETEYYAESYNRARDAGARTVINTSNTLAESFTQYFVKETVHAICAAVNDCADATANAEP